MSTNRQTLSIYWHHAKKYKAYVVGILFGMPITILAHQIIPPIIAADVLNKLSSSDYDKSQLWSIFGNSIIAYSLLMIIAGSLIWRIMIYLVWKLENLVLRDLARTMFSHLTTLDAEFHANSFGGSLVSRTNKFVGSYVRITDTIIFNLYSLLIMFVSTSVILWPKSSLFVVVLLLVSAIYIIIATIITKPVRNLSSIGAKKQNKQTGHLADMVTNIMAVKSFSANKFENDRFEKATESTRRAFNKVMWASLIRETYFGAVTSAISAIALALAVVSVVVYNAEIGTVFLVLAYTANITQRLWDFPQSALRNLNRAFGDAEEATATLLQKPTVLDPTSPITLPKIKGGINFNSVKFSHDNTELFEDFNLKIAPGERIGLVGHSGSGKTTLTKILLRFIDIQTGEINIDDINIRLVDQDDLRKVMSYVPQEPLLFHRSLFENISYGKPNASKQEIVDAAKKAHAHEFIEKLPHGYETLVGERGVKLSGGQRQRIAIARAMIKDAPILVLDEATSALDSESEQLIQDALWKLMEGRTAIVIAHRLSTIQKMDRIIVLDNGKIVEEGTHKKLIKKKNGLYARLWNHQSGGFIE